MIATAHNGLLAHLELEGGNALLSVMHCLIINPINNVH